MTDKVNIMTNDVDLVSRAVARHVGDLRRQRGLTFDQLASASGVSKGMLVQIEQAKANPSIGILFRIAGALGVSVADLVEAAGDGPPPVRLVQPGDGPVLWRGAAGGSARLLIGCTGADMLELWAWELRPGEVYESSAHGRHTQELLHVTAGVLSLRLEQDETLVPTGGSAHARTDLDHAYACAGPQTVNFTMVVLEPGRATPPGSRGQARAKPA